MSASAFIRCPKCGKAAKQRVIDTRLGNIPGLLPEQQTVYRRRKCTGCQHRWSTYEIEADVLQQIMQDHLTLESAAVLARARSIIGTAKAIEELVMPNLTEDRGEDES